MWLRTCDQSHRPIRVHRADPSSKHTALRAWYSLRDHSNHHPYVGYDQSTEQLSTNIRNVFGRCWDVRHVLWNDSIGVELALTGIVELSFHLEDMLGPKRSWTKYLQLWLRTNRILALMPCVRLSLNFSIPHSQTCATLRTVIASRSLRYWNEGGGLFKATDRHISHMVGR